jgi:hypothetical protein
LTSPRFNFNEAHFGQSLKFDVPGPGQYKDEKAPKIRPKSSKIGATKAVVFETTEKRFKTKGQHSMYNLGAT